MISLDAGEISAHQNHKLLAGVVVPRPIAFVTTLSSVNGVVNAAPFSYFNVVSSEPPLVSISVARSGGELKDTARNLLHSGEGVIHIVDEAIASDMNETAARLGAEQSELELTRLTTVASKRVSVPGIAEAAVRMEVKLHRHLTIEDDEGATVNDFFLLRVVYYQLHERVYNAEKGYILTDSLKPVSRLAGNDYAKLGERFVLERP